MTRFILSTMYAQTSRFDDGAAFAKFALDAGYDGIEISHSTRAEKIEAIHAAEVTRITSIHQPAPFRQVHGRPNSELNLASTNEEDRAVAVAHTIDSIELAARVGANAVVVHLGFLDLSSKAWAADREVRRMFAAGQQGTPEFDAAAETAMRHRIDDAAPFLEAARRSLKELVEVAAPRGIKLGLESRLNLAEIPIPSELPTLLEGYTPREAGYWHDVGHAEVLSRLGYIKCSDYFEADGVRCVGAHVHDVTGITDHRAPGAGDVDFASHARYLSHLDAITLEINQNQPEDQVRMTVPLLRSSGFDSSRRT